MTQPIVFGDVEAAVVAWAKNILPAHGITATVATRVPNPRPARLVRPRYLGGELRDVITDRPRFVIECWAENEPAASQLARTVRALLKAAAPGYLGPLWCGRVVDAGLAPSPDPDTGTPRYLITAELHITGKAL